VGTGIHVEAGSSVQLSGTPTLTCGNPLTTCFNVHHNNIGVLASGARVNIQSATIKDNNIGFQIFLGSSLALFNSVVDHSSLSGVQISDNSSMTLAGTTIRPNGVRGITAGNLSSVSAGGPANDVSGTTTGIAIKCDATSRVTGTNFLPGSAIVCASTDPTSSPLP